MINYTPLLQITTSISHNSAVHTPDDAMPAKDETHNE